MAKSVNQVVLMGRLTRDPEQRAVSSGKTLVKFGLAVDGTRDGQTSFFDIIAWEKLGDLVVQYLKKGHRAIVVGRLQQETWENKETGKKQSRVEIVATDVVFLNNDTQNMPRPATSIDNLELSDIPF